MNIENDFEFILATIMFVGMGILVIVFLVWSAFTLSVEQQCLSHGWKEGRVTWNLERYCIREENEYEITRLLSDIKEGGELEIEE